MSKPPTPNEAGFILAIRMAVKDREWDDDVEQVLVETLRLHAMSCQRQRKSERDWERKKAQKKPA